MKYKKVTGLVVAVLGLVMAGAAYAFRPPSNFSEAMMMAAQGQKLALNQPAYIGALIIGLLLVVGGVWLFSHAKDS